MKHTGIKKVLNIGWGWMVLLCIVFPVLGVIFQFILLMIELFGEVTVATTPIVMAPLFILMLVYFFWLYVISIRLNKELLEKEAIHPKWFKICFWNLMAFTTFIFILLFIPYLVSALDNYIPFWVSMVLEITLAIYYLGLLASYMYLCYFTSTVLEKIFKSAPKRKSIFESLPYFMTVWVFPFGIPFFNQKFAAYFDTVTYQKELNTITKTPAIDKE